MEILCIGDLHIKVDNIEQIDRAEEQILRYITTCETKPDATVIMGDVLHTHERLHVLALNRANQFFAHLSSHMPVFVLVGNHDYIQNDQFLTDNHWMNALKKWPNLTIVDRVVYSARFNTVFLPYVPNGRFIEALNTLDDVEWEGTRCIFAHQEFAGANMRNGITSIDGDKWSDTLPLVISGHIHGRQTFSGVHYVGSTLPALGAKSTAMTQVNLSTLELKEVPLIFSRKQTLTGVSIDQLPDITLDDVERVIVRDTYDKFALFSKSREYMDMVNRGIKVSFKPIVAEKAPTRALNSSFEDILYNAVLEKGDSFLYCALERVYRGCELNEADLLIVKTFFSK